MINVLSSRLRQYAALLSALIAVLVLTSAAGAVDLDFNVANGNYTVAGNWVDATTGAPAASSPTDATMPSRLATSGRR